MNTTEDKRRIRIIKRLFSCGILLMICEVAFAVAYFLRHLLARDLTVTLTLALVAILWVKMLKVEDRLFQ